MEDIPDVALCDACYVDGKSAYAWTFCMSCHRKLCTECELEHTKSAETRTHKIVKLKGLAVGYPMENSQTRSLLDLSRCDYHELKDVKYFCYDHKEVYCSLCRAVKHAHCNEKPIVDICDELETKDLDNVFVNLGELAEYLDKARQERQRQIREMKTMKENCIQEVQNLKQRIAMLSEQLDVNAGQKIAEVDRRVEAFAEKATLYDDAMKNVSALSQQVKHIFECGDKEAIFTAQTKARKLQADYTTLVEQYMIDIEPLKPVLNQDAKIIDLLSKCESLGEVNTQTVPVHNDNGQVLRNPESITPSPPPSSNYRAYVEYGSCPQHLPDTQLGNHQEGMHSSVYASLSAPVHKTRRSFLNIKLKNQKQYAVDKNEGNGITGLAFMPSGDLVICDNSNKTIKVLDPKFNVIHCTELDNHPWDVAVIDKNEVAVTLPKTKTVQRLVNVSSGLVPSGSFQTRDMCWGIVAFNANMIITLHNNLGDGYVEIRSRTGMVLKTIANNSLNMFYVSLDSKKKRFYVTVGDNNSVMCYTVAGEECPVAQLDNLEWPKGIVLDEDSNMLVSSHMDQLQVINSNGQCESVCDVQRPQALVFRWDDLSLVVGTKNINEITVLTFENK